MTWFTKETPAAVRPPFGLSQRGRSSLEILGSMQKFASSKLRSEAKRQFEAMPEVRDVSARHSASASRDTVKANLATGRDLAARIPAYRLERFCQYHVALQSFARAIPAIEERRAGFEAYLAEGSALSEERLDLAAKVDVPRYYGIDWHLEPGGWDGYDLYGPVFSFALGPYIFKHGGYAALNVGDDLKRNREDMIAALPKDSYARIYEPGCGAGTTMATLRDVFPDAEIIGCDLSPLLLRAGNTMAERREQNLIFKRRELTSTGEADDSFDAVVTYALHHELPPKENVKLFAEIFRIMKPGADFVLADPPPFREVDLFQALILDWETENRGEPFFTVSGLSDWNAELGKVGFTNVESYSHAEHGFPWIIRGTKPAEASLDQAA